MLFYCFIFKLTYNETRKEIDSNSNMKRFDLIWIRIQFDSIWKYFEIFDSIWSHKSMIHTFLLHSMPLELKRSSH